MAKVLLTTPPWLHFHSLQVLFPNIPPLNLQILAGVLRNAGHEVMIADIQHLPLSDKKLQRMIESFRPDIIGFSVSEIATTPIVVEMAAKLRERYPNIKWLAGGQAPSFSPDLFLGNNKPFDAVALYEGENTIANIVSALAAGSLSKDIPGAAWLGAGGKIERSKIERLICDLDNSPLPYVEGTLKRAYYSDGFCGAIETARGCPFKCNFCPVPNFYGNPTRYKSAKRILEEIRQLKAKGATEIAFNDDSFGTRLQIAREVFETMIRENMKLRFGLQIRADIIAANPDLIELGAKAGLGLAVVGFEGYTLAVQAKADKGNSAEINYAASRILRRNGIFVYGTHIFGGPGTSWRDNFTTFLKGRFNSDIFRMTIFTPVPGSPIYNELSSANYIDVSNPGDFYEGKYLIPNSFNPFLVEFMYFGLLALHYALPDTLFKALFHSNLDYRVFHRRAYKAAFLFVIGQIASRFRKKRYEI